MSNLRENLKKIGFSDELLDELIDKNLGGKYPPQETQFEAESYDVSTIIYSEDDHPSSQNFIIK